MKTILGILALVTAGVTAQEGIATLPRNYSLQFENAWVKVTAVRYGPNEKLAAHTHTPNPAAYVYLNDGPPVIFAHDGGKAATRPATKAGAVRIYRGLQEVHSVENTGSTPSEFLRVELKTDAREPGSFWGKYERGAASVEPVVHFNHPQLRISRVWVGSGQRVTVRADAEPALLIALAPGNGISAGQERWVEASGSIELANTGAAPVDFLRFDFKTRPAASSSR
jgi:hypothetical protein